MQADPRRVLGPLIHINVFHYTSNQSRVHSASVVVYYVIMTYVRSHVIITVTVMTACSSITVAGARMQLKMVKVFVRKEHYKVRGDIERRFSMIHDGCITRWYYQTLLYNEVKILYQVSWRHLSIAFLTSFPYVAASTFCDCLSFRLYHSGYN